MIGELLGHYRIRSAIGAGGMGEVFRAADTTLLPSVATPRWKRHFRGRSFAFRTSRPPTFTLGTRSVAVSYDQKRLDAETPTVQMFHSARPSSEPASGLLTAIDARSVVRCTRKKSTSVLDESDHVAPAVYQV